MRSRIGHFRAAAAANRARAYGHDVPTERAFVTHDLEADGENVLRAAIEQLDNAAQRIRRRFRRGGAGSFGAPAGPGRRRGSGTTGRT